MFIKCRDKPYLWWFHLLVLSLITVPVSYALGRTHTPRFAFWSLLELTGLGMPFLWCWAAALSNTSQLATQSLQEATDSLLHGKWRRMVFDEFGDLNVFWTYDFNLWCVSQDIAYYKMMSISVFSNSVPNISPPWVWSVWLWIVARSQLDRIASFPWLMRGRASLYFVEAVRSPWRSPWGLESLWNSPFFYHSQFLFLLQFSGSLKNASALLAFAICGLIILFS